MALTPLTRVQQATIVALVEARRLDAVPSDLLRAGSFLRQAEERLNRLPLLTSVVVRYGIAYDSSHDTGEALLAAYGVSDDQRAWAARGARSLPARGLRQAARRQSDAGFRSAPTCSPGSLRGETGRCYRDCQGRAARSGTVRRRSRPRALVMKQTLSPAGRALPISVENDVHSSADGVDDAVPSRRGVFGERSSDTQVVRQILPIALPPALVAVVEFGRVLPDIGVVHRRQV